jgi:hypothetical protein
VDQVTSGGTIEGKLWTFRAQGTGSETDTGADEGADDETDNETEPESTPETTSDTTKRIDLQAVVDNNAVRLTWTLSDITPRGQEVYRDTDADPLGRGRIGWMREGSEFVDSDVTPGITYYYWIKATESDLTVTNSTAVSATVPSDQ